MLCLLGEVEEIVPGGRGAVEQTEVLKDDRDVLGGVGISDVVVDGLCEIQQGGCELGLVAIEKSNFVVQREQVGCEIFRSGELLNCKCVFVCFEEADCKFAGGARECRVDGKCGFEQADCLTCTAEAHEERGEAIVKVGVVRPGLDLFLVGV